MKKISLMLIAAAALAVSVTVTAQARTVEEIKKSGTLILATEGAYPPFNFFQGSKLTGFEVELGEALAKKMGYKLEWKTLAFDSLLSGLKQDRWDAVIASFGITPERSKAVTFTAPHYCSGGQIATKGAAIDSAAGLAGKTIGVQTGSTYMENVKKVPGIKDVKNYPQDTDARSALVSGRVDAWVSDRFVIKEAMEAAPQAGLKAGGFLFIEKIALAVKKGNAPLAAEIDKALGELMADGTYKTISEKYFKEDIRCK